MKLETIDHPREDGKYLPIAGALTIYPSEDKKRLCLDLPSGAVKYENGVMRLVLEPGAPLTLWERRAP